MLIVYDGEEYEILFEQCLVEEREVVNAFAKGVSFILKKLLPEKTIDGVYKRGSFLEVRTATLH